MRIATFGSGVACLIGAGVLISGIFITSSVHAQVSAGRWLWLSGKSATPVTAGSGGVRGQIAIATAQGRTLNLISYSNDTEGWTNTVYQCPELIVRYSAALGFGGGALGNGHQVARNFASRSGGQFTFQRNGQSSEPPYEGAVISISGTDTLGRSFPPPDGQYGHVGIVQNARFDGNNGTVVLFDQNWPSASWKTISFERRNGAWFGTMTNNPRNGAGQLVDVVGWANPAPAPAQAQSVGRPARSVLPRDEAESVRTTSASLPATPRNTLPGRTNEPGTSLSGSRTFHIVKVRPGHTYRWTVKACNAAGCSEASERLFFSAQ
jgi:surface antigen